MGQHQSHVGMGCKKDTVTKVRAKGAILVISAMLFFFPALGITCSLVTEIHETQADTGLSWKP